MTNVAIASASVLDLVETAKKVAKGADRVSETRARARAIQAAGGIDQALAGGTLSRLVNVSLSESLILGLLKQRVSTFFAIFGHGSTDIANVLSVYDEEGVTRTINRFNPDDPRVPPAIGNGLERHVALECTSKSILGSSSMDQKFDRAAEDLGNSIHLEHVNVQVPDQRLATLFYATGLGLTRDPYLMVAARLGA